jgi:large subunit ribosomal protein L24e
VKIDAKYFHLLSGKVEALFLAKKNPRKIGWTQLYRRKQKKGQQEQIQKKKTRKTQKIQRAIVGAPLEEIRAKKNQKPEVRAASREAALREIKERKKKVREEKAQKKKEKITPAQKAQVKATKQAQKVSKNKPPRAQKPVAKSR